MQFLINPYGHIKPMIGAHVWFFLFLAVGNTLYENRIFYEALY